MIFQTLQHELDFRKLGRDFVGRFGHRKDSGQPDPDDKGRRGGVWMVGRRNQRNRGKQQRQERRRQNRTARLKAKTIRTSPVGDWLRRHAPDVLRAFADMVPAGFLLDSIAALIETRTFKPNDRSAFELALDETRKAVGVDVGRQWSIDAASDSWLSKNVRPLVLFSLTFAFIVLVFANALFPDSVQLNASATSVLETLLLTVFGAYFAGRTIEKAVR